MVRAGRVRVSVKLCKSSAETREQPQLRTTRLARSHSLSSMYLRAFHLGFDVVMGAVLLHWAGSRLANFMRHDTVAVIWECLITEWRRLHAPQPATKAATELTTNLMYR